MFFPLQQLTVFLQDYKIHPLILSPKLTENHAFQMYAPFPCMPKPAPFNELADHNATDKAQLTLQQ